MRLSRSLRRGTALLSAFLLSLCTIGCNDTSSDSDSVESFDFDSIQDVVAPIYEPNALKLSQPDGFEVGSNDQAQSYFFKDDAIIIPAEEPMPGNCSTLADYASDAVAQYKQATTAFSLHNEKDFAAADGTAGRSLEFSYEIMLEDTKLSYRCLAGYLLQNGTIYMVTCKSKEETFASHRDTFWTVLTGAKINETTSTGEDSEDASS